MGRISGGGGGGEGHAEAESGGIEDCSPGTIVWVRRRNGSWWPGRILGPDELPASQIMSPRTGTPVKLLGREDASVDWYNLEKSKRVKAFRCGEFDACIDRAKSSEGTPVKRREKYARREDAILHALELERKQRALKYQNQGLGVDDTCIIPFGDTRKEFDSFSSEYYSKNNRQEPQLPLQRIATQQCKDLSSTRYKSKKNKKRKVDSSLLLSKTKEYEQKFLHAGSKRNLPGSLSWEASENTHDNHMNGSPRSGHMQGGSTVESSEKNIALKKKRTEESAFEESLVKKHDRFRPLSQVAQSSLKLPHSFQHNTNSGTVLIEGGKDPTPAMDQAKRSESTYMSTDSADAYYHGDMSCAQIISTEGHFETQTSIKEPAYLSGVHTFSGFVEKHGSDYSDRECSETETEDDAQLLHTGYAKRQSPESDACDPYSLQASNKLRYVNDNDDADDEVTFSTCNTQQNVVEDEDGSSELGISQWHMKGKRNQRSAAKRPIGKTDGNISLDRSPFGKRDGNLSLDKFNSLMKGSLYRANEGSPKVESIGVSSQQSIDQTFYQTQEEWGCDSDETDLVDNVASHLEANRYFGEEHLLSSKLTRDIGRSYTSFNDAKNSCKTSPINKNVDQISSLGRKAYGEGSSLYQWNYGSHHSYMGSMLFNVDLKVQSGYQGEHVPLVCLMSRLNGKAIVGHPVQIEILEDGSTEHLDLGSNIVVEHSTITPPAWRTGRRTAMPRVPNSYSTRATLDDNDDGGLWEMKPPYNRFSVPFDQQARLAKKNISSVRRPSSHQKKPSNTKKGSSSSQKLRALSSISIGKKHLREGGQAKAHRCRDILGGLIKSEGVIPLVTCVPAKVVFSRIMEAVGRPSLAVAHRVRMTSPAVRDLP